MKTYATWICTDCWQRAAKCQGLNTELLEIPVFAMEKIEELQLKLDQIEGYMNEIRHKDKTCSLESQGFSDVECAEIYAEDSIAHQILAIIQVEDTPLQPTEQSQAESEG